MIHQDDGLRRPHWRFIIFTLLIGLLLNLAPVPAWLKGAQPDWLTLVVFYWALTLPQSFGVFNAWLAGFLQDLFTYALLGQFSLGKAFTAMVAGAGNKRINRFGLLRQSLLVLIIQAVNIAIVVWIHRFTNGAEVHLQYWVPAISTALLWPIFSLALSHLDPSPRHLN